jgi:hypothetical protein
MNKLPHSISGEYKIPFKKLKWIDNVTDIGQKKGLIYWIGSFTHGPNNIVIEYQVANSYASGPMTDKLMAFCKNTKMSEFDTVKEAKEHCQKHFEQYIMETFFNI